MMYVVEFVSEALTSLNEELQLSTCIQDVSSIHIFSLFNPLASGIQKVLLSHITGLFSVKIQKKFLAIKNFSVNDTMSGQPNKRLIHWHFEN